MKPSEKRSEQGREKTGKEVARINERKRKKVHDEKRGKNKPGLRRDRENRYGGEQKRRTTREGELARARQNSRQRSNQEQRQIEEKGQRVFTGLAIMI